MLLNRSLPTEVSKMVWLILGFLCFLVVELLFWRAEKQFYNYRRWWRHSGWKNIFLRLVRLRVPWSSNNYQAPCLFGDAQSDRRFAVLEDFCLPPSILSLRIAPPLRAAHTPPFGLRRSQH